MSGTSMDCIVAIIVMLMIVPIKNTVTKILGKLSFEIYVMQGIMLIMLFNFEIENIALYAGTIIVGTVILAVFYHPIDKQIY